MQTGLYAAASFWSGWFDRRCVFALWRKGLSSQSSRCFLPRLHGGFSTKARSGTCFFGMEGSPRSFTCAAGSWGRQGRPEAEAGWGFVGTQTRVSVLLRVRSRSRCLIRTARLLVVCPCWVAGVS
jgi:hypothetical protein